MLSLLDPIRRKPRTFALIAAGIAAISGYVVFVADDPSALWTWAPLALCMLMHGLMHGGHAHGDEPAADAGLRPVPVRRPETD